MYDVCGNQLTKKESNYIKKDNFILKMVEKAILLYDYR